MDPCGTPYFTASGLEMLFPIHKLCFRSDKYDSNHFIGSQTAAAYSIVGRTKVVNARSLADWGQVPMFLLKKAKVLFAFFVTTSTWVFQERFLEMLRPTNYGGII